MEMCLLHLMRHGSHGEVGRVLSGRSEIALDALGTRQSERLVHVLDTIPVGSIHSSPRRRALQTAAPMAAARGLAVQVAPGLDEIDFGAFTGLPFDELDRRADWHAWNEHRDTACCPGGETMAQAIARAMNFLFATAATQAPALCFTHCDIIRGVVAHVLGLPMDRIFLIDCDPASVTTLSVEHGAVRLVTLNSHGLQPASA